MTFSIIITTHNRPTKVSELVTQLLPICKNEGNIIVVDSSDSINYPLKSQEGVVYLRSAHKNQPYQRFLGYCISNSDLLIFLDDDMEVVDNDFISKIRLIFNDKTVSGVALRFEDKYNKLQKAFIPSSNILINYPFFQKIKRLISGYPELRDGEFGFCGNRGKQPLGGGETEWVSGGAFAVRRSAVFNNFNFQLLDIFEKHLGMGEDCIIGYGISKQGRLIYNNELFFLHNGHDKSTYIIDEFIFAQMVTFSRLYLSMEKARLDKTNIGIVILHYHYFELWRVIGLIVNLLLSPSCKRWLILKGSLAGWWKASLFRFSFSNKTRIYWEDQASKDANSGGI